MRGAYGLPKIFIAAVGEAMTQMCAEVADGVIAHAFTTKRYLEEVTRPALLRGMARAGRDRSDFQVACPVFVVTGENQKEHGWGDLQTELHRLSRQGDWDAMGAVIDDDVLDTFAVVAPVDKLAAALRARCDGVIDRVMPAFPKVLSEARIAAVVNQLREKTP